MKIDRSSMLLYAVTDRTWLGDASLPEAVEQAIKGGLTFVQLREKNLGFTESVKIAAQVKAVTDHYHIPFVINDNVEVALMVHADGVHLGQSDESLQLARAKLGQDKIIGLSAQTVDQALQAEKSGADYIGVGAVFGTSTKLDADAVSLKTLKEICQAVDIPVVAIGGISTANILELSGSGVDGVAVISAIFAQPDMYTAACELKKLSKQMVGVK